MKNETVLIKSFMCDFSIRQLGYDVPQQAFDGPQAVDAPQCGWPPADLWTTPTLFYTTFSPHSS